MQKICPKCGKPTEFFYRNLCLECYLLKIKLEERFKEKIKIFQCPICENFILGKRIIPLEEIIKREMKKRFKPLKVNFLEIKVRNEYARIKFEMKIDDLLLEREGKVKLEWKKTYCRYCQLMKSGYYESILQIRNQPKNLVSKVYKMIEKIWRENKFAFISKTVEHKNGIDLYLGSKGAARKIARILRKNYNPIIKVSRKFYGFKNGKKIYRETILIDFG
jgi:nonsense-mediated mRNA decay protein 3